MRLCAVVLILFCSSTCFGNKYSEKMNSPDYGKLLALEKPFRIQKLNIIWDRAVKKLPSEKLKQFYTDLKYQDKEELALKKIKADGLDKKSLKESMVLASFKAILEKYSLYEDFQALQQSINKEKSSPSEISADEYYKSVFQDKKLNKLWLKAEHQGFSDQELKALKEEFEHHQKKIDQYYNLMNKLHDKSSYGTENTGNTVEQALAENEKLWKSDNPHQMLKEKHYELKAGYDYLNGRVFIKNNQTEFEEPRVNILWETAKNASFTESELRSLQSELHHFEHRIKKLKILGAENIQLDDANVIPEVVAKKNKKLKEYEYKVEKIERELSSRILQKHSEL